MTGVCARSRAAVVLTVALFGCGVPPVPRESAGGDVAPRDAKASTTAAAAQMATGNAYGVPQDSARALTYYRTAAENGDAYAQDNLGLMYFTGQGVPQDYVQAAHWYRQAAEQGYADAQFNLGAMYFTGQGVPQDFIEARKWYTLAASKAAAEDQKRYTEWGEATAKRMTPEQIGAGQRLAREWQAGFDKRAR